MLLSRLQIEGLRCLSGVDLRLKPGLTGFCGANGVGKTSLLEAVFLLGHGRSFRSRHAVDMLARGHDLLRVTGEGDPSGPTEVRHQVGVEWRAGIGQRARLDGRAARSGSELARALPMLLVGPDAQRMLGDGARERRAMLDWMLFHVEPGYHEVLRRYRRALAQYNAALKGGGNAAIGSWSRELSIAGSNLNDLRVGHAASVLDAIGVLAGEFLATSLELRFQRGWKTGVSLVDALREGMEADRAVGRARFGPHRADVTFLVSGRPAHRVLSRGEGKLLIYAPALGEVAHVSRSTGSSPMMLLDDLASELDVHNRSRLLTWLVDLRIQVLITSIRHGDLTTGREGYPLSLFHVERGIVTPMV